MCVFGTRPEAIKMAPVVRALEARPDRFEVSVCVTGQHREMLDQMLELFEIRPDFDLDLMRDGQSLTDITTSVLHGLARVLEQEQPDWVLVQGDTTTTMAASLAAFYANVRIGHVEAGLRTWNMDEPRPEEMNRRVAGVLADLHFAPTELAAANLRAEGIPDDQISVTGNTVIDAFHSVAAMPFDLAASPLRALADDPRRVVLVTVHRRENHGAAVAELCAGLRAMARNCDDVRFVVPVHLNPNIREPVEAALTGLENVLLVPPLDYRSTVWLLERCHFVMTDSGGLQEEAVGIGKPVLILRETTERSEGVAAGTARLVGCDRSEIAWWAARLLHDESSYAAMAQATSPYGDGTAGEQIAELLAHAEDLQGDMNDLLYCLDRIAPGAGDTELEPAKHA
jgi:UDP-N-acetylglucosamine 2-epimerase (non-hydrolysing)